MTVTPLPLPQQAAPHPGGLAAAPIYQPAPAGAPDGAPRVFAAIASVMRDVMPVAKDKENQQQRYKFRGVDDAMSAMAGPMRAHGLFILPIIAAHRAERRGEKMTHVNITMRYHVYGPAGDCLTAEVPGEASDYADKATNKAQSAALKYLLFTLFMIPVDGRSIDDGDRDHPVEPTAEHRAEHRQRQQQRAQQRQQRGQQPRRSQRAEQGPWEQQAQQAQQHSPRRDYLAEAQRADNPHQFAKVRAAAAENGAPADYLARLDAIATQKRAAAEQGKQDAPQQGEQAPPPSTPKSPEAAAADAENALRLAASKANLASLDAAFERVYGLPIGQAPAAQLDAFRQQIEAAAAKGAQQ
ncbi:ERF family protein [Streptomyces sp. TP-A0875]|uniref:ERF family protein n=1 Tax=Streptomyces sp. TP-A0875 TaxID=552354 RepID=UPI0006B5927F|nr:ERF family protein [Streptomyces sp. TP-A0875]